jgi:hypothetical protein
MQQLFWDRKVTVSLSLVVYTLYSLLLVLLLLMCIHFSIHLFITIVEVDEDPAQAAMALAEQQWVNRCRSSAIIVSIAWVAWVVVAQVLFTDIFPVSLYVRIAEQGEYTGW